MNVLNSAIKHITETAKVPSFSSYEERLHPYFYDVFSSIDGADVIPVAGNNLIYGVNGSAKTTIALTAHLDKINHYGDEALDQLNAISTSAFIEGAMDDCAGLGILLAMAELSNEADFQNLLFFFSEMEEKKGLKDHPELLKNDGKGYESGMGAKRIAKTCLERNIIPDEIITVDTTPLFKGKPGVALYSEHWKLNELEPTEALISETQKVRERFKEIYPDIVFENNTNDYLHYGKLFNEARKFTVPSVALEPSIYPYHQKGERVFISDIKKVLEILEEYLKTSKPNTSR